MTEDAAGKLETTPLHALHQELGAKLVPFAGYEMPVQFPAGILAEHLQTRAAAGLFDVSHMGQVRITGNDAAARLETLVPGDIQGLAPGAMRYTQFTNPAGGILDDLIVTRRESDLFLVVNAAVKAADIAHMRAHGFEVEVLADRALMALQGPAAQAVMARLGAGAEGLKFMHYGEFAVAGQAAFVTRSGYTGEDGFEISVPAEAADGVARALLAEPEVEPVGLGARDSLRLEAGLCLYGHDITAETTPVEAGLTWSIGKRRRAEGGFPGAERILKEIADGAARKRVGLRPEGRAPAREGAEIVDGAGATIGHVTSGGFGPTVGGPVAMGYVPTAFAKPETEIGLRVRAKVLAARVRKLPFIAPGYAR